ncbi:MAG TPA: hypothetical protein VNA89_07570 [Gemmatimonadaceae bacterium]|nr:hypothetical protein [Gemmatimonadaceae bacterium]
MPMSLMLRIAAAFILASALAAGSAAAQGAPRGTDVRVTVSAPPTAAFARVVAAFGNEGLTIGESSSATGRITSRPTTLDAPGAAAVVVRAHNAREGEGSVVTLSAGPAGGATAPPELVVRRRLERVARAVAAPR